LLDRFFALNQVGGDPKLLREVAALFLKSCPRELAELQEAVARRDSQAVRRLAHAIKGMASPFGPGGVIKAAQDLEAMGQGGTLTGAEEAYTALAAGTGSLQQAL